MTVYTGLMPGRTTLSLPAWMAPTGTQVTHEGPESQIMGHTILIVKTELKIITVPIINSVSQPSSLDSRYVG